MKASIRGIIDSYYEPGSLARAAVVGHSEKVAEASLALARRVLHLDPDMTFIEEAAMLHDIGVFYTNSPGIGCSGNFPYICHGYLGGRLLRENHGLPAHAQVCERHVGVGLSAGDIRAMKLPLPARDMLPETIEETIICFADAFFSKTPPPGGTVHEPAYVLAALEKFGRDKVERFSRWLAMFGAPSDREEAVPRYQCQRINPQEFG